MKRIFSTFTLLTLVFLASLLYAKTTSSSDNTPQFKLKKINNEGETVAFTVQDALEIVRFFMSQEGVEKCESDPNNNTLKIVSERGISVHDLLLRDDIQQKMDNMGYEIEFLDELVERATSGRAADCDECGEVKLSDNVEEDVLQNAEYEGEVLIDFNMESSPSSGSNTLSQSQLDSIRQALFAKPKN
ncbi:MAG: hypothetical protein ACPG5B_07325 [Chitinophagales bacterium]